MITGRSHNVAAQATTLGKRFANAGEELLQALRRVDELLARYPLRGIKGPVGTQQDQLDLLGGDAERSTRSSGASPATSASTPCSPTSARCTRARSTSTSSPRWCRRPPGPSSLAITIRLMAGHELATEGFQPGPGRLVGHAPQDEHPLVRAHQRLRSSSSAAT